MTVSPMEIIKSMCVIVWLLAKGAVTATAKIARHRKAIWVAGRELGVPISRLLKHDNSKFTWVEFWALVLKFEIGECSDARWKKAWAHHVAHNDHHIEYWQLMAIGKSWVYMPDDAVREMVADWIAACLAYTGKYPVAGEWEWGHKNLVNKLCILENHSRKDTPSTRAFAVGVLFENNLITEEQVDKALARNV